MKNTIDSIRSLEKNWDGEGAKPINSIICSITEIILSCVDYELDIFPTARGFIQLEYESVFQESLEAAVYVDHIKLYLYNNVDELTNCETFKLPQFKDCIELINKFCEVRDDNYKNNK